jgi:hypothetical protein
MFSFLNPASYIPSLPDIQILSRSHLFPKRQVFRKAENGPAYLDRVRTELHMRIQVVPQVVEGQLGYLTAVSGVDQPTGATAQRLHIARPTTILVSYASSYTEIDLLHIDFYPQAPSLHTIRVRPAFKSPMCATRLMLHLEGMNRNSWTT